ncbi:MAG: GxxExxY protein [Dehalococcoidia bacterium]|nr:MAG: GxxExxY protein [Dehalococcoidia bacterium]
MTIKYNGKNVGTYQPDFVIDNKILIELKAASFLIKEHKKQFWNYIKGSEYKLGFLINFGGKKLEIIRRVYDTARRNLRISA